jgi:hypothetical protein
MHQTLIKRRLGGQTRQAPERKWDLLCIQRKPVWVGKNEMDPCPVDKSGKQDGTVAFSSYK